MEISASNKFGKDISPSSGNNNLGSSHHITLLGAGLAGCLMAIYLAKRGFKVNIYERHPDIRKTQINSGRSINLTLAARGIKSLKEVGLYDKIMQLTVPLKGRIIHGIEGRKTFQPYGPKETDVLYGLQRSSLSKLLLDEVEKLDEVQIHFSQKCVGIDFDQKELYLRDEVDQQSAMVKFNVIIGTDGSSSALRTAMLNIKGFNFSQSYLKHGYKEITIPSIYSSQIPIERNALHVWPRGDCMINGFPNLDGSTTCVFFAPFEGENGFDNLKSEEQVTSLFQNQFSDIFPFIPDVEAKFSSSKTGHLITIKCDPWHVEDKALLLGDSAHAIVPFHGQGMNCAFEDCAYLDKCIAKYGTDWKAVFQEFERNRKVNTDSIADLSLLNYVELREQISDQKFLLKKEVEKILADKYPEYFIPRFSMVCFNQIPYSVAQYRGEIQQSIIEELCEQINDIQDIEWKTANNLMTEKLIHPCSP